MLDDTLYDNETYIAKLRHSLDNQIKVNCELAEEKKTLIDGIKLFLQLEKCCRVSASMTQAEWQQSECYNRDLMCTGCPYNLTTLVEQLEGVLNSVDR